MHNQSYTLTNLYSIGILQQIRLSWLSGWLIFWKKNFLSPEKYYLQRGWCPYANTWKKAGAPKFGPGNSENRIMTFFTTKNFMGAIFKTDVFPGKLFLGPVFLMLRNNILWLPKIWKLVCRCFNAARKKYEESETRKTQKSRKKNFPNHFLKPTIFYKTLFFKWHGKIFPDIKKIRKNLVRRYVF